VRDAEGIFFQPRIFHHVNLCRKVKQLKQTIVGAKLKKGWKQKTHPSRPSAGKKMGSSE
jgi:hypothetical protein